MGNKIFKNWIELTNLIPERLICSKKNKFHRNISHQQIERKKKSQRNHPNREATREKAKTH